MTSGTNDRFALSSLQQQAWNRQALYGGRFQGTGAVLSIAGRSPAGRLAVALSQVVARHEILRTTFESLPGSSVPTQLIRDSVAVPVAPADGPFVADHPALEASRFLIAAVEREPSGAAPVALRAALASPGENRHLLALVSPALCADRGTMVRLYRDLAKALEGQPAGAQPEPMQYADLAVWLNALQAADHAPAAAAFWRGQALEVTSSEGDRRERPVDDGSSWEPGVECGLLPEKARQAARLLASRHGAALATVMFACWQVLLWRQFRRPSMVVGVPFDLAEKHGLDAGLGPFTAVFPLDCRLDEMDTFDAVVQRTQALIVRASAFSDVISGAHFPEGPARCAFGFDFTELPAGIRVGELALRLDGIHVRSEPFRLKLSCVARQDGLVTEWQYDRLAFTPAEIERFAERLSTLLMCLADGARGTLPELTVAGPRERCVLLEGLAGGVRLAAAPEPVVQMIERHARATPERIAVESASEHLSYGDLDIRSNAVARRLTALGAGPASRVGVFADRECSTIVGILGVLKAQAAFVPLDPRYPPERNRLMANDAGLCCLLARDESHAAAAALVPEVPCLHIGRPELNGAVPERFGNGAVPRRCRTGFADGNGHVPADLAYVVYTSGTTGRPKGALITRANLAHSICALRESLGITGDDVYLHTAAMGFSSSMRQWFVPLTGGARVVLASDEQRRDPGALFELMRERNVTIADLVPSHWRGCLNVLGQLDPAERAARLSNHLRLCLSASEPLASDIPHTWKNVWKHPARFVNMFGHSETCGIVSLFEVPASFADGGPLVPLGRPLSGTRIYLLGPDDEPAAWGEPGEVCIAGPAVGAGYMNLDDVSRRQFVGDRWGGEPQCRLYRTGDLARFLADGNLEFLSRCDDQVKLRGHRVELAEIEARLAAHASVSSCAVTVRGEHEDDRHLAAYVVSARQPPPAHDVLRAHLKMHLPEHMLPASFVFLQDLPRTPSGKLDRKALAGVEVEAAAMEEAAAPQSPIEAALLEIWREVLGTTRVGIDDDFFDLGGHSLMATRIVTRVRHAFRAPVSLRMLFESPTIATFARALIACEARPGLTERVAAILVQPRDEATDVSPELTGEVRRS